MAMGRRTTPVRRRSRGARGLPEIALAIAVYGIAWLQPALSDGATTPATSAATAAGGTGNGNRQEMTVSQGILGLSDDDFWDQADAKSAALRRQLLKSKQPAFFIDAPSRVVLERRQTAPVVCFFAADNTVLRQGKPQQDGVVVALNLRDNSVLAQMAWTSKRSMAAAQGAAPGPGMGAESFTIDLRDRLGVPWQPGEYLVNVILRDQVSNRVRIRLASDKTPYVDPEVARHLDARRKTAPPPSIFPPPVEGASYPTYRDHRGAPPVPTAVGIALLLPRIHTFVEGKTSTVVHGSFRLPSSLAHVVERDTAQRTGDPTALVPLTIIGMGSVSKVPQVWSLMLPSYAPIDQVGPVPTVTGVFALDLNQLSTLSGPQTYFFYALSGETMTGPTMVGLVSPDTSVASPGKGTR
jgi:hypothetical protein